MKRSREWVLKNIEEVVRYAVDNNCIVSVGAEDALRADIDYHGHNEFGMAMANALAAYKAGAKYISCILMVWEKGW
ncbi:hypothetical protein [Natronospora cellulosivora (SeqCode)]